MKDKEKWENLEKRMQNYFDYCDALNEQDSKKIVKPYTVSGMLCYIGITKEEAKRLSQKKKYEHIFSTAMARIESCLEENSLNGNLSSNASMNYLKYHFDWCEKQPQEENENMRSITVYMSGDVQGLAR